jgi:hypothetical protein
MINLETTEEQLCDSIIVVIEVEFLPFSVPFGLGALTDVTILVLVDELRLGSQQYI